MKNIFKQIQVNKKTQKKCMQKTKTIQDYENKCSKNETTIEKQETQIKSITDNRNRI